MAKPILVVLHGMGDHTAESFKKEVKDTLDSASSNFPNFFKSPSGNKQLFSSKVDIKPIAYNKIFNDIRTRLAENSGTVLKKLTGLKGLKPDEKVLTIANKITELDSDFSKDTFLNTHWLDVILYKTFLGEKVRTQVGKELATIIEQAHDRSSPIFMMGHSLGTAVLHDSLHKLYSKGPTGRTKLSISEYQIPAIFMVANVSKLIHGARDPYKSLVTPTNGLCAQLINIRHHLDPFTWPLAYEPATEPGWIAADKLEKGYFRDIRTSAVTDYDTHAITHYLSNPNVYIDIFATIFGFDFAITPRKKAEILDKYLDNTGQGRFDKLKETLDQTRFSSLTSIEALIDEGEAFWKFIKEMLPDDSDETPGESS